MLRLSLPGDKRAETGPPAMEGGKNAARAWQPAPWGSPAAQVHTEAGGLWCCGAQIHSHHPRVMLD